MQCGLPIGHFDHLPVTQATSLRAKHWPTVSVVMFLVLLPPYALADFQLLAGQSHISAGFLETKVLPSITLSPQAAEALVKGIPLTINLDVHLYKKTRFSWHSQIAVWQYPLRIQYHALSNQFTLTRQSANDIEVFPTLSETLDGVGTFRIREAIPETMKSDQSLQVRARITLDHRALPGPLRLMVFFLPSWQLTGDWHRWQVTR